MDLDPDLPERHYIELKHYRQRYTWDCGVSSVLMVLPEKARQDFLDNFQTVCQEEGFQRSTWTIDLFYLLLRYQVKCSFCTTTLGVHPNYKGVSFYTHILTKDEQRINNKFQEAKANNLELKKASVKLSDILKHLSKGPAIVLTNAKLLYCERCKYNKVKLELRKCIPWPETYQGHYIVLCGYNLSRRKVFYRNPSFVDHVCCMSMPAFEACRKSYGTDEDIIFIYN